MIILEPRRRYDWKMSNASPSRLVNGSSDNNKQNINVTSGHLLGIVGLDYRDFIDNVNNDIEGEEEEEEDGELIKIINDRTLLSCDDIIDTTTDYREVVLTSVGGCSLSVVTTTTTPVVVENFTSRGAYNMVAAMNDHHLLSSSSSSSSTSSSTTTTTTMTNTTRTVSQQQQCTVTNNNHKIDYNTIVNSNNIIINKNTCDSVNNKNTTTTAAAGIISFPCDFDHMYASMNEGGTAAAAATATTALGVSPMRGNESRQNDLTEVKHLKELLLLHLDLIQQQSEQIVTKDKLLAALRQENETLKLRLERMDRRVNLQKLRTESTENSITLEQHAGPCSPPNLNSSIMVVTTNEQPQQQHHNKIPQILENSLPPYGESFKIRLNTSGGITTVKQEPLESTCKSNDTKQESVGCESRLEWEAKKKRRSDPTPLASSGGKRKRGVSCSSSISNDTTSTIPDGKSSLHESSRKSEKKGKSLLKKEPCLTTEEHYYTAVGDPNYPLKPKVTTTPMNSASSLEVPNWRIKVYTSCYTMEGTENLDDEIFNKRHLKLENDERRRKRWDVQRIREQRHVEKLKQRQERQNHHATCYNTNHTGPCASNTEEETIISLWPDVEQIQNLQVDPQLPVSAFGAPIPSFSSSEFSLPWLHTTRSKSRRPKRSTGRRKSRR